MRTLANADVKAFISERPLTVIHCDANWDGYRTIIAQKIKLIEEAFFEVGFGYIDVDKEQEFARKMEILNVPSVLYFEKGELVAQVIGKMQNVRGNLLKLKSGEKIDASNQISRF